MSENKLSLKNYIFIGSMLFGLFFGAGNLIFPIHMGQEAGAQYLPVSMGLLITGIGLPFLGIIAMALTKSEGVYDLSKRAGHKYGLLFTILLYLVIGPFFAIPRLATTAFEIAVNPQINPDHTKISLFIFSCIFFLAAWFFSRKPNKLLSYVGKILNPIFLVLLSAILIMSVIKPMGVVAEQVVQPAYQTQAFFLGFKGGYYTLDALAALAFGIIVIEAVKSLGITKPKDIAISSIKSGFISVLVMGVIYTLLTYAGASSLGTISLNSNGGITLSQISVHYLGSFGNLVFSIMVIVACFKTTIGLITSFSETFHGLFPKQSYIFYTVICSVLPCIFANVGLTTIIAYSTPVLLFVYPPAIALILLGILDPNRKLNSRIYKTTIYVCTFIALFDALNVGAVPEVFKGSSIITGLNNFANAHLPLYDIGLAWFIPTMLAFVISYLVFNSKKQAS